jgi:hypothetical protein
VRTTVGQALIAAPAALAVVLSGFSGAVAAGTDPAPGPAASADPVPAGAAWTPPEVSPFRDVSTTDRFYAEIAWLQESAISVGWADGTYRPLRPVTRDVMAAFLNRHAERVRQIDPITLPAVSPFADVSTRTTPAFYRDILSMEQYGYATGWTEPDGTRTYRPDQPVARDAMAAFFYRVAGSPDYTPPAVSPFADVSTTQPFYKEMAWLEESGIATGWTEPDGTRTYRPDQPVARDAMAAFLYRLDPLLRAEAPG